VVPPRANNTNLSILSRSNLTTAFFSIIKHRRILPRDKRSQLHLYPRLRHIQYSMKSIGVRAVVHRTLNKCVGYLSLHILIVITHIFQGKSLRFQR